MIAGQTSALVTVGLMALAVVCSIRWVHWRIVWRDLDARRRPSDEAQLRAWGWLLAGTTAVLLAAMLTFP